MCKILIQTAHNAANLKQTIAKAWHYFDTTGERDGFGAVWISPSGQLCWLKSSAPKLDSRPPRFCLGFAGEDNSNQPSNGGFLLIHGRKATCYKSVTNTHPMLGHGSALIHNGIVRSESIQNETTTCDSELLLIAMKDNDAQQLAKISGYFAFGMIQPTATGWRMHVAKDETAKLFAGRNRNHGYTFGTTPDACLIGDAKTSYEMRNDTLLTFTGPRKHSTRKISHAPPPPPQPAPTPQKVWPSWESEEARDAYVNRYPRQHTNMTDAEAFMFADEPQEQP
ncbi:MAG: hypothetical protein WCH09_03085 [Bacteroidota bacterium]